MKKSIICTILGITVGLGLGKMTNNVETIIIRDEKNVELETIHTYLENVVVYSRKNVVKRGWILQKNIM